MVIRLCPQPPIGTANELFLLNNAKSILKLRTKNSNKETNIHLNSEETKLYTGGFISFSKSVNASDIEYLNSWREGETLLINWTIEGFAVLPNMSYSHPIFIIRIQLEVIYRTVSCLMSLLLFTHEPCHLSRYVSSIYEQATSTISPQYNIFP